MSVGNLSVTLELDGDAFITSINRGASVTQNFTRVVDQSIGSVNVFNTRMQAAAPAVQSWVVSLGQAEQALRFMNDAFLGVAERIVDMNSKIERTTLLMKGLSTASTDAARMKDAADGMTAVLNAAGQTPFKLETLTDTFVKLKTAGVDPLNGSMKALTDAIAAFGGNDQRLERAAYAIQEMAGRGVISLQNLRRQLGQDIPGAVELMARSMNLTVAQLDEAVTKGTLASRHAITLLLDEFQRTYGGAAGQLMQTFSGQVSRLTTSLTNLALVAGGQVRPALEGLAEGGSTGGGFYASVVKGMGELNRFLQSDQMAAHAVSLNLALKGAVEQMERAAHALVSWQGPLEFATKGLLALGAANLVAGGITRTFEGIAGVLGTATAGFSNLLSTVRLIPGMMADAGQIAAMFGSRIIASVTGVTLLTTGVQGLTAAMAGLTVGFAVVAVPAAILAGLGAIIYKLTETKNIAEVTGDALKRIRMGDVTDDNQKVATRDVEQMRRNLATLQEEKGRIAAFRGGRGLYFQPSDMPSIEGDGGVDAPAQFLGRSTAAIQKYADDIDHAIKNAETKIVQGAATIQAAAATRIRNDARLYSDGVRSLVENDFQQIEVAYRDRMQAIEHQREALAKTPGNHDAGNRDLNEQAKQSVIRENQEFLDAIRARITAEQQLYDAAAVSSDTKAKAQHARALTELQAFYQQTEAHAREAAARFGTVETTDDDKAANKAKTAATALIERYGEQIAALRGQMDGEGKEISRIIQRIANDPGWNKLGDDTKAKLTALAGQLDSTRDAFKRFQADAKAEKQIDAGLEKAIADLARYNEVIADPHRPEAQRNFAALSLQMGQALNTLSGNLRTSMADLNNYTSATRLAGLAMQGMKVIGDWAKGVDALNTEHAADTMKEIARLQQLGEGKFIASLSPAARNAAELAKNMRAVASAREGLEQDRRAGKVSDADYAQRRGVLDTSERQFREARENRDSRIGAGAARAAMNEVTTLEGRIAQLRAKIADEGAEEAKWVAEIARGKFASQGAAITERAAEYDRLLKIFKDMQLAHRAEINLDTNAKEAADARQEGADLLANLATRGKMLGIEQQILDYRLRQNKELNRVVTRLPAGQPGVDHDGRIAAATANRDSAVADETFRLVAQQVATYKTAAQEITKTFDDTVEGRRRAGLKELAEEDARFRQLLAKTQMADEQRKQSEDALATYITARRKQMLKQPETEFEKWIRENADTTAQLGKFGSSAISQLQDSLTNMATTGKLSFSTLADWAIKELTRITLSSAFATLAKGLGGSSGGGFDFMSLIGKVAGAFGGGAGVGADGVTGAMVTGGFYHSGGLAGLEPTFARMVPSTMFADVPRFHTGTYLKQGEVPAILRDDEAVFTQGQLGAIGRMNHSYDMVERAIGSLASHMGTMAMNSAIPASVAPNNYDPSTRVQGAAAKGGTAPPMTVNMNNQTGSAMGATASQPRFDGEQWVLDVVLKHANKPGPLRNTLQARQSQ